MNQALHILQVGIVFLLMITVLVAAHELGHYLFARLFRMGIHEFAIGFGRPKLWTWRRSHERMEDGTIQETEFNFRAWPLGGFVRIRGMEPMEDGSERQIPNGFYSRPAWQRFIVLLAGPVFSVASGLLVLTVIYWSQGAPKMLSPGVPDVTPQVERVEPGYAAANAGVLPEDTVTAVDGTSVASALDVKRLLREHVRDQGADRPLQISVDRAGKPLTFALVPRIGDKPEPILDERGQPTGQTALPARIGVVFRQKRVPVALQDAVARSVEVTGVAGKSLVAVFTRPKEAKENVGGVVSMVGATDAVVSEGIEQTLGLAAMLSISIGFFNLLPVPPLDGGQMLLAVAEMVRGGRRPSLKFQNALVSIGSVMLLTLFVGVLILDVSRVVESRKKSKPTTPIAAPTTPASNPAPKGPTPSENPPR